MASRTHGFTLIELMIVVGIIAILAAVAIPLYQDYTLRTRVTDLVNGAAVCKTGVAEFYKSKGKMPASIAEAGCAEQGTGNASPPSIAPGGVIIISAVGPLANQLAASGSGVILVYNPMCGSAQCAADGSLGAITAWDCSIGTMITAKYLPPECRG
jgi:type IV pilus assembly protein PilA